MSFWKNLSIRKKLSYSILGLTTLLALTAGITSGVRLQSAQSEALWTKGKGLSAVLGEAVTPSYLSDDLGTTSGSTDRSLDFVKGDPDVSLAAVVAVDRQSKAAVVKFFKNFGEGPKLDPATLAGPLGQGKLQYRGERLPGGRLAARPGSPGPRQEYLPDGGHERNGHRQAQPGEPRDHGAAGPRHGGPGLRRLADPGQRHRQAPGDHPEPHARHFRRRRRPHRPPGSGRQR